MYGDQRRIVRTRARFELNRIVGLTLRDRFRAKRGLRLRRTFLSGGSTVLDKASAVTRSVKRRVGFDENVETLGGEEYSVRERPFVRYRTRIRAKIKCNRNTVSQPNLDCSLPMSREQMADLFQRPTSESSSLERKKKRKRKKKTCACASTAALNLSERRIDAI